MNHSLTIAHRGAAGHAPENTLLAFKTAVEKFKVDMIELDVRLTKDGIPIICHDPTTDRTTNVSAIISELTYAELSKLDAAYHFDPQRNQSFPHRGRGIQIPKFEDTILALKGTPLCVEIKERSKEIVHTVMDLLKRYGVDRQAVVGSKYHILSKTMRKAYPHHTRFCSRMDILKMIVEFQLNRSTPKKDPHAVASLPPKSWLKSFDNKAWIDFIHRKQMKAFFWTINDREEIKHLLQEGANGIVSNYPERVKEVLESLG